MKVLTPLLTPVGCQRTTMLREESSSGPVPVPGVPVPTLSGAGSAGSSPEAAGLEEKNNCQKEIGMLKRRERSNCWVGSRKER